MDPTKVKVYGGSNIAWNGKKDLSEDLFNKIISLSCSYTLTSFYGTEYLLVNLCSKETPKEDVGLILNAFCFELQYEGTFINELSVERAYSFADTSGPFISNMRLDIHKKLRNREIAMPIAYACPFSSPSLLNLNQIADISQKAKTVINLVANPEKAGEVIGFSESAYLIKCITNRGDSFLYTIHMRRHSGKLEYVVYSGNKNYKESYKSITKKIHKKIELVSDSYNQRFTRKIKNLFKLH